MIKPRVIKWNHPDQFRPLPDTALTISTWKVTTSYCSNGFKGWRHVLAQICEQLRGFFYSKSLSISTRSVSSQIQMLSFITDTDLTQSGNTVTVFLLLCLCWSEENWFCHLTLCFVATQCLQNSPLTHRYHRYSHGQGLACMGGSSFRVWETVLFLHVSCLYSHWPNWCVNSV